jgi:hypothetical protein
MTVLSQTRSKDKAKGFAPSGRYSYIHLLLQFAADWKVDLPWVRSRITALRSSTDFAHLMRDIITNDKSVMRWAAHPNARAILWDIMKVLDYAWSAVFRHTTDRQQLTLEYLADALQSLKDQTRTA